MSHLPEVVIIGHLGINVTQTSSGTHETLGGAAYYTAVGARTVENAHIGVVARVGSDNLGQRIIGELEGIGVIVDGIEEVKGVPTARFIQTETGPIRRDVKVKLGAAREINTKAFPKSWGLADYIHLATAPPDQCLGWIKAIRRLLKNDNRTVSTDTFEVYALTRSELTLEAMRRSSLMFLNLVELAILNLKASEKHPFPPTPYILKLGAGGATHVDAQHKKEFTVSAPQVRVVDTTGAGDVLAGAYLAGLSQHWSPEKALKRAVKVASESVTRPGVEHILKPYGVIYKNGAS